jgi:hypothetical protein
VRFWLRNHAAENRLHTGFQRRLERGRCQKAAPSKRAASALSNRLPIMLTNLGKDTMALGTALLPHCPQLGACRQSAFPPDSCRSAFGRVERWELTNVALWWKAAAGQGPSRSAGAHLDAKPLLASSSRAIPIGESPTKQKTASPIESGRSPTLNHHQT